MPCVAPDSDVFQIISLLDLRSCRSEKEPVVDLGPPNSSLQQVVDRIRRENPRYKLDLLAGGLVHVGPAQDTADPLGILNVKLHEFYLPPDDCLQQQMDRIDSLGTSLSHTPELSQYLLRKREEWNRKHGRLVFGVVGDFPGGHWESSKHRDRIFRTSPFARL
jgi:hypothetical protein